MTQDISAQQLKALRLAAGLEPSALARQVSLSTAQLLQLEGDQDSLFYTPAIRRQAARKVYFHLTGHWPVHSDPAPLADQAWQIADPGPDQQAPSSRPISAPELVSALALAPAPAQPTSSRWGARPVLVSGALFLGLGLSGWLAAGRPLPQTSQTPSVESARLPATAPLADSLPSNPDQGAQSPPVLGGVGPLKGQAMSPSAGTDQDLVAMMPAFGPPLAPAQRVDSLAHAPCQDSAEPAATLQLPVAKAPTVRLVSAVAQWVCVTDGAGQASQQRLAAGQGAVLAGSPPWLVQAGSLRQVQIYAQGTRLAWPAEMGNRVHLLVPQ